MKKFLTILILISTIAFAKAPVFAVVVDDVTYNKTTAAIDAYCQALEAEDGFKVELLAQSWKNPEAVKAALLELGEIEGAVFIGDIPIAMVQNAQHMTSAFKIDQERYKNDQRISVATDRYYDDPDLVFDFIKQDEENPLLFYYTLSAESPQKVEKNFYSGRIYPPVNFEKRYELLAKYLLRAAEAKKNPDVLDNVLTYAGHGYHSEALNAWETHTLLLKEQFPQLFVPGGSLRNYFHNMSRNIKDILMKELQKPELDFAIFHAHGGDDVQYLIGYPEPANARENIAEVKRFVRSKLRTAKRRGNFDEAKEYYINSYGIPESWADDVFDPEVMKEDSLYDAKLDLWAEDVKGMKTQAELFMFDECYNGQFFMPNYISGTHLFGEGTVLAGIANSVNVRQDIWANEMLGLLKYGVPVGEWHLARTYLESHIIGDPTFHFAGDKANVTDWSAKKLLRSKEASQRTLGVYKLAKSKGLDAQDKLIDIFNNDCSGNVRLQALKSLAELRTPEFREQLPAALEDPNELIRRFAVNWMGKIGKKEYIPLLADKMANDVSKRVSFSAKTAGDLLFAHECEPELLESIALANGVDTSKINYRYRRAQSWLHEEIIPTITNKELTYKKRKSKMRTFRNYNFAPGIPVLLEIAHDRDDDPKARVLAIEALGWFVMNPDYQNIIEELKKIENDDEAIVLAEAKKSIKRLEVGPNLVITP